YVRACATAENVLPLAEKVPATVENDSVCAEKTFATAENVLARAEKGFATAENILPHAENVLPLDFEDLVVAKFYQFAVSNALTADICAKSLITTLNGVNKI
ncbi:MAG: hypothetical protein ACRD6X_22215, partial [Pyrinomonadaceae bacterium]